jgi:adenosylmethionine-8-amino-7-oxononanoate aminotransferase
MLAPPYIITEQEIDLLVSLFEQALTDTLRTLA